MKITLITNVHFQNPDTFDDLCISSELTAQVIRSKLVSRLKRGEDLVAVIDGAPPRAIILRATIEPQLKGTSRGDELALLPPA